MFKVGDEIDCVITEIDKEKRRVAISHRLTTENPFEVFEKKHPIGSEVEGEVASKNEYSIFLKIKELDIDTFLHCNDLTYQTNGEEELTKYKIGDKLKVKAFKKSEFLFIAGKPIGEPIARGGPFVMNTKAEILEAIQDYNNGTFAKY